MSSIKPKFYGRFSGGHFIPADPLDVKGYLTRFEGKEGYVVFSKSGKPRTTGAPGEGSNQNGYLWGVVIKMIADEIGEFDTDYVLHWALLKTGYFKVMPDGEKVPIETSQMEAGEFQEMCKKIQMWANGPGNVCEFGLYIPDPHEVDYNG